MKIPSLVKVEKQRSAFFVESKNAISSHFKTGVFACEIHFLSPKGKTCCFLFSSGFLLAHVSLLPFHQVVELFITERDSCN